MPDIIEVAPFAARVKLVSLWPPASALPLHRLVLALVPADAVPGLAERLGLLDDDLYQDADHRCVVLGEAYMGCDQGYHPLAAYDAAEASRLTRLFHQPQQEREARERAAAEKRREQEQVRAERAERWAREQAEEQEARRQADPNVRLAALEAKLAALAGTLK